MLFSQEYYQNFYKSSAFFGRTAFAAAAKFYIRPRPPRPSKNNKKNLSKGVFLNADNVNGVP